jgi:hypothetical protein
MRRIAIYLGRHRLHEHLTWMEANFPDAGLAPCRYGRGLACMCNQLARRNPKWPHKNCAGSRPGLPGWLSGG